MKRRSNDALYFTDDLIRKVSEGRSLKLWDCVNLFFPKETNQKQFDCAFKFLQALEKQGSMLNTEALGLFDSRNECLMFVGNVVPKLKKFGLLESDGNGGSKKYSLRFGEGFSKLFRDLGLDLYGFYARHVNERK